MTMKVAVMMSGRKAANRQSAEQRDYMKFAKQKSDQHSKNVQLLVAEMHADREREEKEKEEWKKRDLAKFFFLFSKWEKSGGHLADRFCK